MAHDDENPAQRTMRLRSLQDRYLALPAVRERIQTEGEDARIHGAASPTFREVFQFVQFEWGSFFVSELNRLDK